MAVACLGEGRGETYADRTEQHVGDQLGPPLALEVLGLLARWEAWWVINTDNLAFHGVAHLVEQLVGHVGRRSIWQRRGVQCSLQVVNVGQVG